ncbi:hypothetical protein DFJ73DRAFT_662091 [Zopfochytrium polystomum]|nr:hypothetical protein DFJ73DRAFT_662091 [Zopfochytrium polystomum]
MVSAAPSPPQRVAVLGGGIAGLAAAWFLARSAAPAAAAARGASQLPPPAPQTTLFEASDRFGGWLQTRRSREGYLFETGPRTLRPAGEPGAVTLELIHHLGLADQILTVPRTSPGAKNRLILYNDQLNLLPSSLPSLLLRPPPPVLRGLLPSLLREPFAPRRPPSAQDESIASFLARRFGSPAVADRLVSAVVRGIYAGDARRLSVRSTLGLLWRAEARRGSVAAGVLLGTGGAAPASEAVADPAAAAFVERVKKECSVYSFRAGIQQLSDALVRDLETALSPLRGSVALRLRTPVSRVSFREDAAVLELADGTTQTFDHVVSALPASALSRIVAPPAAGAAGARLGGELGAIEFVNVAVVNLAFAGRVLPIEGFGYLVPFAQRAQILGAVFDSSVLPQQDADAAAAAAAAGGGGGGGEVTRLTVMMGGHMFEELFGAVEQASEERLREVAVQQVKLHLGIKDDPVAALVSVHRDCIPQYTVGHAERLQRLHALAATEAFGRLSFVGSSYLGVGVNDCIKSSRDVVRGLVDGRRLSGLEGAFDT